jgi:AcrR family transcriptional regulator
METGSVPQDEMLSRAFKTKMDIAKALNRLCGQTPFARISIQAIADIAGVSRSSFYHHFEDKNGVVHWLSLMFYDNGIDQIGRTLTWFEGHLATTKSFRQFKALFTAAADESEYSSGRPFFIRHRQQNLSETLTEYKHLELTKRLAFQIEALPYAEMIMTNNFENDLYDYTLKEFCELMVSLVPTDLLQALEQPVNRETVKGDFLASTKPFIN